MAADLEIKETCREKHRAGSRLRFLEHADALRRRCICWHLCPGDLWNEVTDGKREHSCDGKTSGQKPFDVWCAGRMETTANGTSPVSGPVRRTGCFRQVTLWFDSPSLQFLLRGSTMIGCGWYTFCDKLWLKKSFAGRFRFGGFFKTPAGCP
jgi:hypothetical protein